MTGLVGIAAVVVVAWFAAGTIWNVRLGRETMRWMQDGLPLLGGRTTVRWLGSSVVELVLKNTKPPFSSATLVVFLEPRDLPWWPLSRLRGRRDTLIIRGVSKKTPSVELEVLDPSSWSGRDALRRVPAQWSSFEEKLLYRCENVAALELAKMLLGRAEGAALVVKRLSVRRAVPGFQLHVALPDRRKSAREFFEAVRALGELAFK